MARYGRAAALSASDRPAFKFGTLPLAWQTRVNPADVLVHVDVTGEPIPKGRPRTSRARISEKTGALVQGHQYTPERTRQAEEEWRWILRAARLRSEPVDHPVGVLAFYKTAHGTGDGDNFFKLSGDALQGTIVANDNLIGEAHIHVLRHCTHPGTSLLVWTTGRRAPG